MTEPTTPSDESPRRTDRESALAAWEDYATRPGFRLIGRSQYGSIARRFLIWFEPSDESLDLESIGSAQVDSFLEAQPVLASTKTHYRSMLRRFFGALVARGLMSANPLSGASRSLGEPILLTERLPEVFATSTEIERQAMVDAAAFALLFDQIHVFTEGCGGKRARIADCEAVLATGEQYGLEPFSWMDADPAAAVEAGAVEPAFVTAEAKPAEEKPFPPSIADSAGGHGD
jgi:hypothetical protein